MAIPHPGRPIRKLFENERVRLVHDGRYNLLEFVQSETAAVVIPITSEGDFVMVEIERVPAVGMSLEFPRGGVDIGETPSDGAIRELREETGCVASEIRHLGSIAADTGIINLVMHAFVATVDMADAGAIEDVEEITRRRVVPRMAFMAMARSGEIVCGVTLAAFAKLLMSDGRDDRKP
jgi:ADP-ribose pyrophosphatase